VKKFCRLAFDFSQAPKKHIMKTTLISALLIAFAASASTAPAAEKSQRIYLEDFEQAVEGQISGWSRSDRYGTEGRLVDLAGNTANETSSLILSSWRWGGREEDSNETVVIGDTGVPYRPNTSYTLEFSLARSRTGPKGEADTPFYSDLIYELWAGIPEKGGILLGSMTDTQLEKLPTDASQLVLRTVPTPQGTGNLHVRFATLWNHPESGPKSKLYQQAEIDDVFIFAPAAAGR
jgi:hypothetical protein